MRLFRFTFIIFLFLSTSCDDGDLITVELDFDKELQLCGDENSANYVIYDIKNEDPFESLTLLFPTGATNDLIFNPNETPHTGTLNINTTSIRFNYRIYDGDPAELICEEIPSSTVNIIEDYEAMTGAQVNYISTFIDDDNDGIPSENEDNNLDGDNNHLTNPLDTDSDGIPDYLDEDDDNDNILTKDEDDDNDNDNNPFTNPRDTDGDDLPNYLDIDDDNDGVITRYEDENGYTNPANDFETPDSEFARYLDDMATDEFIQNEFIENNFTRTVTVEFTVNNIDIEILSSDSILLGIYKTTITNPEN